MKFVFFTLEVYYTVIPAYIHTRRPLPLSSSAMMDLFVASAANEADIKRQSATIDGLTGTIADAHAVGVVLECRCINLIRYYSTALFFVVENDMHLK